ncbi:hypothetical protein BLNAU_6761 [Blattamonas nauphoetae]|uniref:PH domain-containing protein n=1 Tax=Blattamonas nauphoetae TaxID=2049346 RepID=A0ABQ9Y3I1_9EUKA|nr:hypothetical protein BLNAU_6761 [Blattamonas nauphoetae]
MLSHPTRTGAILAPILSLVSLILLANLYYYTFWAVFFFILWVLFTIMTLVKWVKVTQHSFKLNARTGYLVIKTRPSCLSCGTSKRFEIPISSIQTLSLPSRKNIPVPPLGSYENGEYISNAVFKKDETSRLNLQLNDGRQIQVKGTFAMTDITQFDAFVRAVKYARAQPQVQPALPPQPIAMPQAPTYAYYPSVPQAPNMYPQPVQYVTVQPVAQPPSDISKV